MEDECETYLSRLELTKIKDTDKCSLDSPLSLAELGSVLFKMKNGKSPGSDGFTVEFYKFFWVDLKPFIYAMCCESYDRGTMPQTLKEGIIVLLPKSNKPKDMLKSYRPITLLNVCYKIISGAIAEKLKSVLKLTIDSCQTAYLKGRYIGDNIRMLYDIIQHMNQEQISGVMLSLDVEAAFDSVSWHFIRKVLEAQNYPLSIIKWFDTLYAGSFARILDNGHLSGKNNYLDHVDRGERENILLFRSMYKTHIHT